MLPARKSANQASAPRCRLPVGGHPNQVLGSDLTDPDQARGLVGRRTIIGLPGQRVRSRRGAHRLIVSGGLRFAGLLPTKCGGPCPPGGNSPVQVGALAAQYLTANGMLTENLKMDSIAGSLVRLFDC